MKETNVIKSDSMDKYMYSELRSESTNIQNVEKTGTQILKTFPPLVQDIWSSVFKFSPELRNPEEILPSHILNHELINKETQLPLYKELRVHTRLNDINSALATVTIASKLAEELKQEQTDEINKMLELEKQLNQQLNSAETYKDMAQHSQNNNIKTQNLTKASAHQTNANNILNQLTQLKQQVQHQVQNSNLKKIIRVATESALNEVQEADSILSAWGIEPGTLQHLPIDKKLSLVNSLRTGKFKRMAEAIGRMRRFAINKQKTKFNQSNEEICDISFGNDISRLIPSELMLLNNPQTKLDFKRRFAEGKLMQYELRGKERLNKGPIIACIDNSGSMSGDREIWSKAVALALLEIARMQKRDFTCIHFGSRNDNLIDDKYSDELVITILKNEQNISEKIIQVASTFIGGGTDFETPLTKSLEIIETSTFNKADIIFITDGSCDVSDEWLTNFLTKKKEKEFNIYSILIHSNETWCLEKFSNEIIPVSQMLDTEIEKVMEI